jgi:hypothetical protein
MIAVSTEHGVGPKASMPANKACFVGLTPIELPQAMWRGAAKRLHGDGRRV